jgi:O-antigen/teichoic acid export membrane protein
VVITFITAPLILRVMGNDYADDGVLLMRLLAISALANVINTVYVALARVRSNIRMVIFVYAANAILVLGLSFVLLGPLGITGVGLAWLISQTVIAIAVLGNDVIGNLRTPSTGLVTHG